MRSVCGVCFGRASVPVISFVSVCFGCVGVRFGRCGDFVCFWLLGLVLVAVRCGGSISGGGGKSGGEEIGGGGESGGAKRRPGARSALAKAPLSTEMSLIMAKYVADD